MNERVAADLWIWKETTCFFRPDDWVFASARNGGRNPLWPGVVMQKVIRPAALNAGVHRRLGWHTFRHTYSTLLFANGENVKVVQELMRHASSQFTLQVYSQAQVVMKREAQKRLVEALLRDGPSSFPPSITAEENSQDLYSF